MLVGCGAAAGIAATFNAPIAGVIFSLEIVLGEFGVTTFSPLVLSSVTATAISRHYFGNVPAFIPPHYEMVSPVELLFYALMGIFVGLVALVFVTALYKAEDIFNAIPIPDYIKPILGGLIMGTVIILVPEAFGVGYGSIDHALSGLLPAWMLLSLILVKIFATEGAEKNRVIEPQRVADPRRKVREEKRKTKSESRITRIGGECHE